MRLKVAKYLKLLKPQLVVIEQSSALNGTNNNIVGSAIIIQKYLLLSIAG
jgi:hypothetical protein